MEIILHAHHAEVSETLRTQAETAIRRIATRLHNVANAIVRFVGDGPTRRVEIVLRGSRHRELFAVADAHSMNSLPDWCEPHLANDSTIFLR